MAFVVMPIMVAKETSGKTSFKELLKTMCTNSFLIAVTLGLILNLIGGYTFLQTTPCKASGIAVHWYFLIPP